MAGKALQQANAKGQSKGPAANAGRAPKWEKVVQGDLPPFWEPRAKGDSVEGPITQIRPGQYGKVYTLKDARKGLASLKNHRMLDGILEGIDPNLKKGDLLRVTYTGDATGANGKYETYEVEFARVQVPF
jgi:hypothetical protein